jgi:hypothetical protein
MNAIIQETMSPKQIFKENTHGFKRLLEEKQVVKLNEPKFQMKGMLKITSRS